jgi:outer membrane protein OmpA-like peptidoglycan-associated protein
LKKLFLFLFSLILTKGWSQNFDTTEPKRLSFSVNSSAEETTPIISSNGKELYFVRTFFSENTGGSNDQDIWKSEKNKNGDWSEAENIVELNNERNNGLLSLNAANKTAYLTNSYDKKNKFPIGISSSLLDHNGDWRKPKAIDINLEDFNQTNFGFSVSGDQKTMIISGQTKNTKNGEDLFLSTQQNGTWSKPIRLNDKINSNLNEISPFLTEKGDTLYFSSNGLEGFGNYDIFYSTWSKETNEWSNPVNLGGVINSAGFDAYFIKNGNEMYWSSNRNSKDSDIYFAELKTKKPISINISKTNVSKFQGNDGSIQLEIVSGTPPFKYYWSNGSMVKDLFKLRSGNYTIEITDVLGQKHTESIQIIEPLPSIEQSFRLPEVHFDYNSWNFSGKEDLDSLDLIVKLLNENPTMIIQLISHSDCRGDEASNLKLSENRAKAVYTYLVKEKGVDPRRMVPIGKGEADPLKYLDTKTNSMIVLTEQYIETFKQSDQIYFEKLQQLNRRLEGKIISFQFDSKLTPDAPKEYLINF